MDEAASFFDEAVAEHGFGTDVDAGVESVSGGRETKAEDAVAGEGVAAFGPLFGDGTACGERDFYGADCLREVIGVD